VLATTLSAQDVPQMLKALPPRCIGPANMSGRVVDVAVYAPQPRIQYVASAAGGLWKTTNHGTTWSPVFERESSISLGAVAVGPTNPDLVWIGTGEANARNSVSWGDGVYRSTDGGKSWRHMGLKQTEHIGRIVIDPQNADTVYVAALGKLWGPNPERGVFKTGDAGQTWQHVLKIDDNTGGIDLAIDPSDPRILYAAAYQVRRDAFSGGNPAVQVGTGAGLYKSEDAGRTWRRLTGGLPDRPLGRCGVSVYAKDPNIVYAVVQTDKTTATVQGQLANKKIVLADGGIFRSDDKGKTWKHVNSLVPRPFYYGQIRVDPSNDQRLYVLGVNFHVSSDGGKTFNTDNAAKGTHVDYHALWIDPRDPYHLVLGCDGGLNYSFDQGATWEHLKNLPVSQFYAVGFDQRKLYRVYGGLQDNGTWGGPSAVRGGPGVTIADWQNYLGFDGYYAQVHPRDNDTLYCEGQYGILRRINVRTGATTDIKPNPGDKTNLNPPLPAKSPAFRFNWSSPILLDPSNDDGLFYGGNVVFHSKNRGDTWAVVSPDLTRGAPGPSPYQGHTVTTLAISPLAERPLYAGTDDGKLWICRNLAEKQWTDLSDKIPNVPQARWISRVECSRFDAGVVYLAIDRHRNNDYVPYLFKSIDHGQTWKSIAKNLPAGGPVHVIREDPTRKDLLYVGTEFGLFLSNDAGRTWHKQTHLPTVPVHDLAIHPRDRELVIATHGRGIWILDLLPLQEATAAIAKEPAHLFPIRPATAFRQGTKAPLGVKNFVGDNPPYGAGIHLYLRDLPDQAPVVAIRDPNGMTIDHVKGERVAGVQRIAWRLNQSNTPPGTFRPVPAGTYLATIRVGDRDLVQRFQVEIDD
jgi:photosystem II stability/assembly factor-like uncharacterized protein